MSTINVDQLKDIRTDDNGNRMQVAHMPPISTEDLDGSSSDSSEAFDSTCNYIRVSTDTAIRLEFGANPTATTSSGTRMPANTVEYFGITQGHKVAVIDE
jgi:hypothetical protein